MYVTLNPVTVLLGLVHDTVRDVSVMLLNSNSDGGSGPEKDTERHRKLISGEI